MVWTVESFVYFTFTDMEKSCVYYEGHSNCNATDLITQSTDSVPSYAMHRLKEHCLPFKVMYNTLV